MSLTESGRIRASTTMDGQLPLSTKTLVDTSVTNALAGIRKDIVAIEARATQFVKAERKEREGQFEGLRKEFREQQQVVRAEVAEISAALRKLMNGTSIEHQKSVQIPNVVDNFEKIFESEQWQREVQTLRHAAEESKKEMLTIKQETETHTKDILAMKRATEEDTREILAIKQATEEGKKQASIFKLASDDCKVKAAACIDDYVTLKEEVKGMQKTMFEMQAFRVKQDANMAKVLKLFEDHNDDFESIKKFETDIKALIDQLLVHSDSQSKISADLTKAKKKTAECIDEFQEVRKGHLEIKKLFQDYERDCDELTNFLPESKKSADTSLFDRMKIMFHKSHKLQPLADHMEDLKNMIDKSFAELEGELRSKLQKEKEEQLLSSISLENRLDDHMVVGKQHSERLQVLEHGLEEHRTSTHDRLAMVPDKNEISKQLMELTRHGDELAQQKEELARRKDFLEEELAKRDDRLHDELMRRSDALHEQSRKFTAETFHGLRRAQLLDVQSYVKQQLDEMRAELLARK